MKLLDRLLLRLAVLHKEHSKLIVAISAALTLFMIFGALRITIQTDFNKEMPQDLPIFQLNNKISDKFGGQDTVFILLTLDGESKDSPKDIREPLIMQYIGILDESLQKESSVERVTSSAAYLQGKPYFTLDQVKFWLRESPQSAALFSRDYRTTVMIVTADVGSSESKIRELSELITEKRNELSIPPGVKMYITGSPPLRVTIFGLLRSDAIKTILIASTIILLLLIAMQRSFTKAILIFLPLSLGLIWTIGTLGWLNIPLSVATVGIGAMILGLGVEYGVFMLTRYDEERGKGKRQAEALETIMSSIGTAVIGSGMTTIFGFLALTLSVMPLLQKLGLSLALGIFYCLAVAVLVMPSMIIIEENWIYSSTDKKIKLLKDRQKEHGRLPR
jgi:uncharacterized protein